MLWMTTSSDQLHVLTISIDHFHWPSGADCSHRHFSKNDSKYWTSGNANTRPWAWFMDSWNRQMLSIGKVFVPYWRGRRGEYKKCHNADSIVFHHPWTHPPKCCTNIDAAIHVINASSTLPWHCLTLLALVISRLSSCYMAVLSYSKSCKIQFS